MDGWTGLGVADTDAVSRRERGRCVDAHLKTNFFLKKWFDVSRVCRYVAIGGVSVECEDEY